MCVAIAKPQGVVIPEETLKLCFEANQDGCGFAFVNEDQEIKIYKSMAYESFINEYKLMEAAYPDSPFLIHFRIKTHGTTDLFNCHPFRINEDMAFIHNGIISKIEDCPDKKRSDTQMFNELVLQNLPEGWQDSSGITKLIEEYIGHSKLAVLHRRNGGEIIIYNEYKGTWKDDVWFSNTYWDRKKYVHKGHLDHCLQCSNNIKNNIYANRFDVSFCSKNCEDLYTSKWVGTRYPITTSSKDCEYCGKPSKMSVYTTLGERHFCDALCRSLADMPKKSEEIADNHSDDEELFDCEWCGIYYPVKELLEFDSFYSYLKPVHLCVDCVGEAIGSGLITETPEIREMITQHKQVANA